MKSWENSNEIPQDFLEKPMEVFLKGKKQKNIKNIKKFKKKYLRDFLKDFFVEFSNEFCI